MPTTTASTIPVGALTVDMFDPGRKQLVFRGNIRRAFAYWDGGDRVTEIWSGEVLPVRDGHVAVESIPPHGCKLLWIEAPAEPAA